MRPYLQRTIYFIALLILSLLPYNTAAQLLSATKSQTEETPKTEPDSLGRRTPQGTVNGFIKAISEEKYVRASQYLVLSRRSYRKEKERIRIAQAFQRLLDQRGDMEVTSSISNKESGKTDDDLPPGIDKVGTITTNNTVINIYIENQSEDDKPALWLFSDETVSAIANATIDDDTFLDRILPTTLKERKLGGVPVGHWLVVVVMTLLCYMVAWGIVSLISFILTLVWPKARTEKITAIIEAFNLPVRLYLAVWIFISATQRMGISIIVRQRFSVIIVTIAIVSFLMLLWRLADLLSIYTKRRMTERGRISAISVILFLRRTTKAAIVIAGIIAILGAIGVDVTAGLAALGIGGIALALGAQKTMENFVGSVSLIADQPLRVGDLCKVGDIKGTVESIGMRSTTLRTAARTIVTIPNGELAASKIENMAHRDRFLFNPVLTFRMETTPDQLRFLLVEIRALLYSHPGILNTPPIVRFTGITADAMKVEVTSYIEANNFDDSQEVQEDLLLRILDIIDKSGTGLAYPSQTIYFAKDSGNSAEKTSQAEDTVKQWKEKGELQLPKFDPKHVAEIKGSIRYPEEGSVVKPSEENEL
ncbi:mechanosensitive ion channel family protein [Flavobacterium sp. AG291]|uniref:mechanosensitive ion channel family protein n=1 Tax=Flavobacterium sp. AG291 TaxID=2184000 RepID=UPI000E0AB2FD|nr:mechanosensitive ion channel family protein [Flavobacterium sp. AG291]RDI14568.1 MscS family membrane protein [Flavobacterium sp. AG291]